LWDNRFRSIPHALTKIKSLESLDMRHNPFDSGKP